MARWNKDRIDKAMNDFAKDVVRTARANLSRERANATRELWSSIRYKLKKGVLEFSMNLYGAFLDKGVSGTGKLHYGNGNFMPVAYNKSEATPEYKFKSKAIGGDLSNWLSIRNIPVSEFVVRRSIAARGIRPRRFFTNAWNSTYPKFEKYIRKALNESVEQYLDDTFNVIAK